MTGAEWAARLVAALAVGVVACHLLAQGGFYWFSSSVAEPTLAGWWKNFSDWLPAYAQSAFGWVAVAAVLHIALTPLLSRLPRTEARTR